MPHALLQEYLNATEQLWGIVTNGERLRLLRDSSRTARPVYVEFDLRAMLEGEQFSEFALLFRLLHRTRLPGSSPQRHKDTPEDCLPERYHQQAIEAGGRVRDGLRDGVESALRALGDGLLRHPANAELRRRLGLADGDGTRMPQMERIDADPNHLHMPIRVDPSDPRAPRAVGADPRAIGATLSPQEFYRQLLRLVYRLLFLMVTEERKLVGVKDERGRMKEESPDLHPSSFIPHPLYYDHYSVSRLRRLAEQSLAPAQGRHGDLWLGLLTTFRLLEDDEAAQALGVAALDGDLFGPRAMPDLAASLLDNGTLLRAVRALSLYRDPQGKALRRVNYAALDVEELGSVYESLLDYRPVVGRQKVEGKRQNDDPQTEAADPFAFFLFTFNLVSGTERKTTGSYYTRPELVHELIKSALEPVIAERLRAVAPGTRSTRIERIGADQTTEDSDQRASAQSAPSAFYRSAEEAILSIRVCDPAAGSGHCLLAAARRLGRELARVRSGEDQPSPAEYRRAVRDVIARCIYAVDLNPLAVDLCKVALWLESLEPGKPLSFLDSKVRWGNSLVGATRALVEAGIPDEAYKPVTGDDKAAAGAIRKRNKREREAKQSGQLSLGLDFGAPAGGAAYASSARALNAMPDDSVAAVRAKARQYEELRAGAYSDMVRFNLWTAAFFTPLADPDDPAVPTSAALDEWDQRLLLHNLMVKGAFELAQQVGFFHWELEFPEVFTEAGQVHHQGTKARRPEASESLRLGAFVVDSGFDVILGNPPWEQIELKEEEHWVDVPEIARASNKAARERKIDQWRNGTDQQRARVAQFDAAKYRPEAESRFVRASGRFPLTAVGRMNTYALFAEHVRSLLAPTGRAGIIVPTGIATADTTKQFFESLVNTSSLASLFDFLEARDFSTRRSCFTSSPTAGLHIARKTVTRSPAKSCKILLSRSPHATMSPPHPSPSAWPDDGIVDGCLAGVTSPARQMKEHLSQQFFLCMDVVISFC